MNPSRLELLLAAALALPLLGQAVPARAACSVATTGVSFGAYNVFASAPLQSTGSVTVDCDDAPPPDVTISIGASPGSGGFNPRALRHTSLPDRLRYNVFTDAAGTAIWGDGTAGTVTVFLKNVTKNRPRTVTVYGRIPPLQNVSVGAYGDILSVTILP
jgi:spore coat protein U-like protein